MKKKFILLIVTAVFAAVSVLASCTRTLRVDAEELSAKYARRTTDQGQIAEEFTENITDFGVMLLKNTIEKDGKNALISPLSAIYCIGMIANGASGNTLSQIEGLFGTDIETLNKSLYHLNSNLHTGKDCKFNLANSLWIKDGFDVKEGFLQTNADWYAAQVYRAPFNGNTVKDINKWCEHYTDGMIEKIMDKIEPDDLMFLINALSFDAKWAKKYEKSQIKDGDFTNFDGSTSKVDYLISTEYDYIQGNDYTGFKKNYQDDKYSFVGILPSSSVDIYDLIENLDGKELFNSIQNSKPYTVNVKFPEFTYDCKNSLTKPLKEMGMTDAFSDKLADFSAMTDREVYLGFVNQNTFIDVSRNGTKAAAITWGGMKDESAPPEKPYEVYLTRPFVYAIVDNASGTPLFVGAVISL